MNFLEQKTSTKEFNLESINIMCTCNNEANEHDNTSSTYDNEDEESTSSMSEKEEPVKSHAGDISIYEFRKNT